MRAVGNSQGKALAAGDPTAYVTECLDYEKWLIFVTDIFIEI